MVGPNIRRVREQRRYSQEYVAAQLGVDQSVYSRWETGQTKLSVERIEQIAQVLAVPVGVLLGTSPLKIDQDRAGAHTPNVPEPIILSKELIEKLLQQNEARAKQLEAMTNRLLNLLERKGRN